MNEVAQAAQAAQTEFPDSFVEYAREKLKTDRNLVEYLIEFGRPISKRRAQMILDAAGVGDKNGK
jgi:hypothetical protein